MELTNLVASYIHGEVDRTTVGINVEYGCKFCPDMLEILKIFAYMKKLFGVMAGDKQAKESFVLSNVQLEITFQAEIGGGAQPAKMEVHSSIDKVQLVISTEDFVYVEQFKLLENSCEFSKTVKLFVSATNEIKEKQEYNKAVQIIKKAFEQILSSQIITDKYLFPAVVERNKLLLVAVQAISDAPDKELTRDKNVLIIFNEDVNQLICKTIMGKTEFNQMLTDLDAIEMCDSTVVRDVYNQLRDKAIRVRLI